MEEKIIDLTLPEFAFLKSSGHEYPDMLEGRVVILHVRSASVLEVLDWKLSAIKPEVLQCRFTCAGKNGQEEKKVIALHYSATLDAEADHHMLIEQVLKPAITWYCDHLNWMNINTNTYGIN